MNSVCFISTTSRVETPVIDPSTRYRCFHPATVLSEAGCKCSVTSTAKFFGHPSHEFDSYVFHRPIHSEAMIEFVEWARSNGRRIIADYDDLIFGDEATAMQSSTYKNGVMDRDMVVNAFEANLSALRLFDKVTVSTKPLRSQVLFYHPGIEVTVVPNRISRSYAKASMLFSHKRMEKKGVSIMYASGTKSHDLDFLVAEDALLRLLEQDSVSRLDLVGPLAVSDQIAKHPKVHRIRHTDIFRLPRVKAAADLLIAPLELSVFNRCKSGIKFLESAIQGIPLVCTPIDDFAPHQGHFTPAERPDEWFDAMVTTISHPPDPKGLQDHVLNGWIASDHLESYKNTYLGS
ncbi:MAG: glycosyltransferase [Akkermansiaceae bacterium]|jgi:hypothetical protein|nr:glycosyltransferase [Akkermansiaceae bacterium]